MSLSPKQVEAILDHPDARMVILEGAVRSGKTVSTLFRFLAALKDAPTTGLVFIVGKTQKTIENNILKPLMDPGLMGPLAACTVYTSGASRARILGRDVELVGANDVRSEEKIRGATACLAMVDEATLIPEAFWQQLGARLSVPGAKLIATTNPGGPRHWLKTKYLDRRDELDLAVWSFQLDDNPSLEPKFVADLKTENTGIFYQRNVLGRWVAAEGAVFEQWDESKHVMPWDKLPTLVQLIAGIDYGTTNPTDCVILGAGIDGKWYAVDEWRSPRVGLDDATQVAMLASWLAQPHTPQATQPPLSALHVDPAAASFKVALRAAALPIRDADNDVLAGIATVATHLHSGRLRITDRCRWLLQEIPNYAWDAKATERGEDRPVKVDDHAVDSLRYCATAAFGQTSRQYHIG